MIHSRPTEPKTEPSRARATAALLLALIGASALLFGAYLTIGAPGYHPCKSAECRANDDG